MYYPRIEFSTDNAAMIAVAGLARLKAGEHDSLAIGARAQWPLESLPPLSRSADLSESAHHDERHPGPG